MNTVAGASTPSIVFASSATRVAAFELRTKN
jgi:hypothetical protein